jgi:chromosomal replication initiation ATPase DnaA
MTDRLVREVVRNGEPESPARPFSEFFGSPNIVLLGDPGAGKTHLFQSASAPDRLYRARDLRTETLKSV